MKAARVVRRVAGAADRIVPMSLDTQEAAGPFTEIRSLAIIRISDLATRRPHGICLRRDLRHRRDDELTMTNRKENPMTRRALAFVLFGGLPAAQA